MDYDTRMMAVKQWLKDQILPRFTAPANVDRSIVAHDVAEAVNANIPRLDNIDVFRTYLNDIGKVVTQNAKSRTLPVPKDFIDACRIVTKSKAIAIGTSTVGKMCPYAITEKRVRYKEAIGSTWLTELGLADLLANTNLTMEDMQPYILAHKQETSGENHEQNGVHRW